MQTSSPFSFQKLNYGTEKGYLIEDTDLIQNNKNNPPEWHLFMLRFQASPSITSTLDAAVFTIQNVKVPQSPPHNKKKTAVSNVHELFTVANLYATTRIK